MEGRTVREMGAWREGGNKQQHSRVPGILALFVSLCCHGNMKSLHLTSLANDCPRCYFLIGSHESRGASLP